MTDWSDTKNPIASSEGSLQNGWRYLGRVTAALTIAAAIAAGAINWDRMNRHIDDGTVHSEHDTLVQEIRLMRVEMQRFVRVQCRLAAEHDMELPADCPTTGARGQ